MILRNDEQANHLIRLVECDASDQLACFAHQTRGTDDGADDVFVLAEDRAVVELNVGVGETLQGSAFGQCVAPGLSDALRSELFAHLRVEMGLYRRVIPAGDETKNLLGELAGFVDAAVFHDLPCSWIVSSSEPLEGGLPGHAEQLPDLRPRAPFATCRSDGIVETGAGKVNCLLSLDDVVHTPM